MEHNMNSRELESIRVTRDATYHLQTEEAEFYPIHKVSRRRRNRKWLSIYPHCPAGAGKRWFYSIIYCFTGCGWAGWSIGATIGQRSAPSGNGIPQPVASPVPASCLANRYHSSRPPLY
ncbi:hypothetical protein B0T26DRAFT_707492 [Lasiosphaeria miniovina]|uniref:Uncharacterized protein n=1 Tax=Lasiosphaeria miniovina TaxID=1954250 RepID=A0AA40DUH8_9PEZI|nr:uncharacterized protein B0T26DRAFT_707492 [Lasiosphaeria miniovina]KAK0716854.1 hypothetical protein B0T26DRAFT_707492 [Lasiosphaeria miniovina]